MMMTYQEISFAAKMVKGGKVVIPAELRRRHGFTDGATVVFEEGDDGIIRLRSYDEVVREVQVWAQSLGGGSMVDELIAERRGEAAAEEAHP